MGFWAIICFVLAAIAIESGDILMITIFAGLGILFTYLWATREDREKKRREELKKQREELKKQKLAEKIQLSKARFSNSAFAAQVIQDFRSRHWGDLDFKRGSCQIFHDKIVTPYQTYLYINYGLGKLDNNGCEQLALYLGEAYGGGYETKAIERGYGGYSGSYSGYISSDGSVSISPDGGGDFVTVGYELCSKASMTPSNPVGKKW